jgi:hypothetical protein
MQLDKMTSLFIHMEPPLILYIIRHRNESSKTSHPIFAVADICLPDSLSWGAFLQLFLNSVLFYLVWQVIYHVYITVYKEKNIRTGHVTSATWLLGNSTSMMYKLCHYFAGENEENLRFSYIFVQFAYTAVTVLPTILYYYIPWLHALALILSVLMATWNGANFYFEVFTR